MSNDIMLTAEELRLRRQKRRRLLAVVFVFVILLVLGFFGARPAGSAIKAWQARRHAQRAFACIDKEQWNDAQKEAIAAYQLRPSEPQALRAVARFLSRIRQPEALDFWKQLDQRHLLTREDRRDEVAIALAANDPSTAQLALNDLLTRKDPPPSAPDWVLAAQVAQQKGATDEAKDYVQKILNDAHADERSQFQAALITLAIAARGDPAADAWARLEKLGEGKSKTALDALVILAQHGLSIPVNQSSGGTGAVRSFLSPDATEGMPPIPDLARALQNHPLAATAHKLLALDLQMHADPAQREALIGRAIADWKDSDSTSLTALATWLNGKGEYERELNTIPLEKALQARDLFLQHLDALGALGRWDEVKNLLESDRFPFDPVIQKMYLARCNSQLGEKNAAENNWKRALEAAGGDISKLIMLADYAEKNGMIELAGSAYDRAVAESPKLRVAWQGRLRIAQAGGDTRKIHAILASMLAIWPNDPAVQNDEAYMRLLLLSDNSPKNQEPTTNDQALAGIEDLAENLVKQNPRSLPHRTLLALVRLRRNRFTEALDVYSNIQVEPRALTPSALAVHAAVLFANGRSEEAKTEANQIKPEQLLPEERALIESLRH